MNTAVTNNQQVRDVILTGALGKRFGKRHRFAVASPAEAVRALCAMIKGFQQYLMESEDRGMKYHVYIGDEGLTSEQQLNNPAGKSSITFAPVMRGAKSGVLAAIAGVVLIVVGVFLMFTPFAAFAPYVIGAGVGLLAVGVAQMLAPSPPSAEKDKSDNRANNSFNGPVNTTAQGNPVPYFAGGPAIIGSAVISASISVKDGLYVPAPNNTGAGGGGSWWAQAVRQAIANVQNAN